MNPLAIFEGPYALLAKWAVIGILLASFGGFCYFKGDVHGTAKLTEYQGGQAIATVKLTAARVQIVHEVDVKYLDRIQVVHDVGATIEKEVPIYVTAADDSRCAVPDGFVREHNAAWSGTPPGPPVESDRGPSGVPISEVAAADAGNATACRIYKEQRNGLIEFYRKLQDAK